MNGHPRTRVALRRRLPASVGASALALAVLAVTATPAAAAPSVKAKVDEGTLRISGSPLADRSALRLSARDSNDLQVDIGDDGSADFTFDRDTFAAIDVEAGNGNDVIDGNGGADTAFLGQGDDTFVWDPGDGSDVVEGGSGSDSMVFNGAAGNEIMAATANGRRVLFTRNLGNIVMDLNDVEAIDVRALGGTDAITVNDLTGTGLARVDVDLAATIGGSAGDGQADTITVKGTTGDDTVVADASGSAVDVTGLATVVRITHADPTSDTLVIDTLAGADHVTLDPALAALLLVSVP